MILAEDLKWLTDWWLSLVNEIVNTLLAGCQFRSLPNRQSGRMSVFLNDAIARATGGFALPSQAAAGVAAESSS
jgi:hypothetical protein